jgi:anti-sigma factor RsiW
MNHIDDSAELYALGALDEPERRRVDAHVATCAPCAQRLGEAERAVTFAIEADPQYEPSLALRARLNESLAPSRSKRATVPRSWFAVAAAIAILALPLGFMSRGYMTPAGGGYADAAFVPMKSTPVAMTAHVMYARSGNFYVVVVKHSTRALHVAYVHADGTMETIGKVEMHGDMGIAMMPIDHKMPILALVDGATIFAEANLAFN